MKQLYLLACLCFFSVTAQQISIQDANFEQALIDRGIDQGTPDGVINSANAIGITHLDVSGKNISSLSGIEAFTDLVSLNASNNNLESADFSANTALQELILHNNQLQTINVTANTALQKLNLYKNKLTHIQLSNNTELTYLAVADNYLGDLNVSANKKLEKIFCQNNQLTSLDVSNMPAVTLINAELNNLSDLNVSNSRNLKQLNASNNYISFLDVSTNVNLEMINVLFNNLQQIDLSYNTKLSAIYLANNQLQSLNIRNGNNANLTVLRVENNPDLSCITADDETVVNGVAGSGRWNIDFNTKFSENCGDVADKGDDFDKNFTVYVGNDRTLNIKSTKKAKAKVYNLQGIPVISAELDEGHQAINMNNFMSNVYVLHISSKQGKFSKKFILD